MRHIRKILPVSILYSPVMYHNIKMTSKKICHAEELDIKDPLPIKITNPRNSGGYQNSIFEVFINNDFEQFKILLDQGDIPDRVIMEYIGRFNSVPLLDYFITNAKNRGITPDTILSYKEYILQVAIHNGSCELAYLLHSQGINL